MVRTPKKLEYIMGMIQDDSRAYKKLLRIFKPSSTTTSSCSGHSVSQTEICKDLYYNLPSRSPINLQYIRVDEPIRVTVGNIDSARGTYTC